MFFAGVFREIYILHIYSILTIQNSYLIRGDYIQIMNTDQDISSLAAKIFKTMDDQKKLEAKKMAKFGFRFRAKFLKSSDTDKAVKEINEILKKYECFYKIVKL